MEMDKEPMSKFGTNIAFDGQLTIVK